LPSLLDQIGVPQFRSDIEQHPDVERRRVVL
jgi:hypothetical protein